MYVRLTRKLAEMLDGIDLSGRSVGDVLSLTPPQGELLIAEGWAERVPLDGDGTQPGNAASHPAPQPERPLPRTSESLPSPRPVERLRAIRHEIEIRSFGEHERRRAEDRIREELHDSRAKTLGHQPPDEPTDDRF